MFSEAIFSVSGTGMLKSLGSFDPEDFNETTMT